MQEGVKMKILIVDDEQNIRQQMKKFLMLEKLDAVCAENGESAQRLICRTMFDAVLLDLRMPGMSGMDLLSWIRKQGFRMPVIMISAYGEISDAVQALKGGAQDYVVKPFDPEEIIIKLKALTEAQKMRDKNEVESRSHSFIQNEIIGNSLKIRMIKDLIARLAPTSSTVLITGESGTGKEVVARNIHQESVYSKGPFVPINIGGVPENLLESELFGYEKGAFTGAESKKTGMFEIACGGTLFLDEIGDMSLALQVKMLRVLQERSIIRLGGTQTIPINARIICATNKNLEEEVKNGTFREDLFYRLNVVRINVPPLRERQEDIPLIAASILERLNNSMNKKILGFTTEAMKKLKEHYFYGNVRELENVIERAAIFTDEGLIQSSEIDLTTGIIKDSYRESTSYTLENTGSLRELEKKAIENALLRWEGNRTRASEELGISRRTLISKIREYGLKL